MSAEYDATKRKVAYLEAHPGETIKRDDRKVAPLWRHRDASGAETGVGAIELGALMDRLDRLEKPR